MNVLIYFYFGFNVFVAGYYLGKNLPFQDTLKEKLTCFGISLLTIMFGLPYILLSFLIAILWELFDRIDNYFQLSFFVTYFFTSKWNNLQQQKLYDLNRIASKKDKSKLKHRIYIYCVNLINKLNNYTYTESDYDF